MVPDANAGIGFHLAQVPRPTLSQDACSGRRTGRLRPCGLLGCSGRYGDHHHGRISFHRRASDRHDGDAHAPATTSPPETTPTTSAPVSSTTRPDPPPRLRREVEVKRGPRTALYTLPADLLFDSGEAVLRPSSLVVVDEVARDIVERFPGRPIIVRGHTDSVGGSRANRELSRRRAEAVAAILLDQGGIGPTEIEAFGEIAPRASNETAAGRALNRRVEILVRTRR